MSSFQREREALGQRLREIRIAARLTGRALADRAGWHSSKISKIEAGKQTPSERDLELWAQHCGAAGRLPDLVAALRSLESHYQEHRRQFQAGMAGHQRDYASMEANTEFIRNFESSCVSGLVQTPDYARFRLAEAVTYNGAPDDLDGAVAARMQRQHVLYTPGKRFHIVMTEAALRYRLCPPDVMEGQLDRLVSASTMRSVRLGVIPFDANYPVMPVHGFWLFDKQLVRAETFTAELHITDSTELQAYARIFSELAGAAAYGAEARALITRVMAEPSVTAD
ncbi:helix-turn-helix domain-containing protein [Jiangella alkaliphila]|uniref:Helix-turn-helix domain-containing protein n=1 Tax=Jiangella alkaliphila TaxID=419479 RepID=A0A1H2GCB2_9ACTN|nr:helix-turn-helix transcriptional regulator [Jiangella alkaliphila]SDU17111.1 Helix-turn-helix domain-containing protein [Jiangella alkaliphila]